MRLLLGFILLSCAVSTSFAASFDCGIASTSVEVMICNDESISAQDDKLSILYREARKINPEIRSSQRDWLKVRNACDSLACISSAYSNREAELNVLIQPTDSSETSGYVDAKVQAAENKSNIGKESNNSKAKAEIPAAQEKSVPIEKVANKKDINWGPLVGTLILGMFIFSLFLHGNKKLSIFENYTDLSQFLVFPILILALGKLLGSMFGSNLVENVTYAVMGFLYALWNYHVCLRSNKGHLIAIVVFLVRFMLGIILAFCFIGAFDRSGTSRRSDESATAYEMRLRRQSMQAARRTAFFLALITIVAAFAVRDRGFASISLYWSGVDDDVDAQAEQQEPNWDEVSDGPDAEPAQDTWHQILGVAESASKEEVVSAYKKVIRQYHPDKVASMGIEIRELAERKSKSINVAYEKAMEAFS